ncbi:BON domain-containing protein [Sorangium sp. So ce693]|uniref:BON domain-containing protein n=1 Tax=Sorangium sp. So ce693 TaxID=3133318 RepID=UPI003F5F9433
MQMGPYYEPVRHSDTEILRDVEESLALDSWVKEGAIKVDVTGGVVTLTGTVASLVEKRCAGDDVFDVAGIVDVLNELGIAR